MPEIDRWVIRNACGQLQRQQQALSEVVDGGNIVFINLSATSLNDQTLVTFIQEQLRNHDIAPGRICFEITETAAIADFDYALYLIQALRKLGCNVALDDFGTGMSSFSYLKSLEVDFVKIDGQFVRSMLEDEMNNAIVEAVNTIGHIAGIQTIAEFVENQAILKRIKILGLDYAQGWAVGYPQAFTDPQIARAH
jgi:EAL domain-containing protein (putative c-di-GMP-specific phosphodiesterase class I)